MKPENHNIKYSHLNVLKFEALGCNFKVGISSDIKLNESEKILSELCKIAIDFENKFSRFKHTSMLSQIKYGKEIVKNDTELISILKLYQKFFKLTDGLITPLVAPVLETLGYDDKYSFSKKDKLVEISTFDEIFEFYKKDFLKIKKPSSLDFGALGKGFLIDKMSEYLRKLNIKDYYIDGSGDTLVNGNYNIKCGLEHPVLEDQIIGTIELENNALCASGTKRRSWGENHHIVNPKTGASTDYILATFVKSRTTVIADAIATALFLVSPESLMEEFEFEYLIINKNLRAKQSPGFGADLFTN